MLAEAKENPWQQALSDSPVHTRQIILSFIHVKFIEGVNRGMQIRQSVMIILLTKSALPFST